MIQPGYAGVAAHLRRLVDVATDGARALDTPIVFHTPAGPVTPDWSGTLSHGASVAELVEVGVWQRDRKAARMLPLLRALLDWRSGG